jgi:NAD(P)-dependent dehydrogenase (short-subunit alcohol dehydrogenase family)
MDDALVAIAALVACLIKPEGAERVAQLTSTLAAVYAVSLKAFFIMAYDYDSSVLQTAVDVAQPGGCALAVFGAGSLAPLLLQPDTHVVVSAVFQCTAALLSLYFARGLYRRQVVGKTFVLTKLEGRVYIITGSNTGLGFETTKEIVRMGGVVVMACRSMDKATAAREVILKETDCKPFQLILLELDLNSFASVRRFASDFDKLGLPLHCLINNAGLMMSERNVTPDGLEMVFTANHLSAFLLTSLLIPSLEEGARKYKAHSRIVNVSSSLHRISKAFNFDDVMSEKKYELFATYGMSKLANILFTFELQRRLSKNNSRIVTNCLHPGFVRTEVTRHMNAFLFWGDKLATPVMLTLQKTPPQGAYCTVHVATSQNLEGSGGQYFVNCEPSEPSQGARNEPDATKLWDLSCKLTKAKW